MKPKKTNLSTTLLLGLVFAVIQAGPAHAQEHKDALQAYERGQQILAEMPYEGTKSDYEKAAQEFKRAIALDPKFIDAYLALARVYWNASSLYAPPERSARREQALALYRQVIAIDPTHAEAYYELGIWAENKDERLSSLRRASALNPSHPWAHKYLAQMLLEFGKTEEAVREYLLHLEVSPYRGRTDGFEHVSFAQSVTKAGQINGAVKILEAYMRLETRRIERCFALEPLDLAPYAAYPEFVKQVERLRPYCTKLAHRDRAVALMQQGKTEEAILELELQLKENPRYPDTYFLLQELYQKQGKTAKADEIVVRYLKLEDDGLVRCRAFRTLDINRYLQVDRRLIERLQKECQPKKERESKEKAGG